MPKKFFRRKAFVALRRKWLKKLDASGFEDIENGEDSPPFTRPDTAHLQFLLGAGEDDEAESRRIHAQAVGEYYRLASIFLENYQFRSVFERELWRLHTDGRKPHEIAKSIRRGKNTVPLQHVAVRIKQLTKIMLGYNFSAVLEYSGDACEKLDNGTYQDDGGETGADDSDGYTRHITADYSEYSGEAPGSGDTDDE